MVWNLFSVRTFKLEVINAIWYARYMTGFVDPNFLLEAANFRSILAIYFLNNVEPFTKLGKVIGCTLYVKPEGWTSQVKILFLNRSEGGIYCFLQFTFYGWVEPVAVAVAAAAATSWTTAGADAELVYTPRM